MNNENVEKRIESLLKRSRSLYTQPFADWLREFETIADECERPGRFQIVLDMGAAPPVVLGRKVPVVTNDVVLEGLARYLGVLLYNACCIFGPLRVTVCTEDRALFDGVAKQFHDLQPRPGETLVDYLNALHRLRLEDPDTFSLQYASGPATEIQRQASADAAAWAGSDSGVVRQRSELAFQANTYLGLDVGASSVKAVVFRRGQQVGSSPTLDWDLTRLDVKSRDDPDGHFEVLHRFVRQAVGAAAVPMEEVSGIGMSVCSGVYGNRLTPAAAGSGVSKGVRTPAMKQELVEWPQILAEQTGVPVYALNDGRAAATYVSSMSDSRPGQATLAVSLGTAFSGAVSQSGVVPADMLFELSRTICNVGRSKYRLAHKRMRVPGTASRMLSRAFLKDEAIDEGILSADEPISEEDAMNAVTRLYHQGEPRAKAVFRAMGRHLAGYAQLMTYFVPVDAVVVFGGVASGPWVSDIVASAEATDGRWRGKIRGADLPRFGQAIGAAIFATQEEARRQG